jgi:hypothetical protein
MAKLSKSVLKEIVKECIVEIFSESFFKGNTITNENIVNEGVKRFKNNLNQNNINKNNVTTLIQQDSQKVFNENFERKTNNVVKSLTSDPVMSEIFKDTATTTLQSQSSAESSRGSMSVLSGGDRAAKIALENDPTELFSEASSKWASLAFSSPVKK